MTPEAAFAKLAYLLGKGYTGEDLRTLMEQDCRGELTERPVKVTGQAYLVSRVRPANRASCVVSATSLSRGNSLNKSSTFDAPATLPEGLCQTNSLSAESTPVKSSLPSSFYRRSGKPLDGLLGYVRRSAPDLHTETHPLIHTLKSERDGFGHSHFEVPDCYSLNNTPNPELNP